MQVKLTTLSPIHIGSGVEYLGNAEYLFFPAEKVIVLVDELKVMQLIGEENLHIWINFIEQPDDKQNFLEYLQKRKQNLRPEDVAKRVIPLKGKVPYFTNTLREFIHGGIGRPYIPGSSLKGAIRTALFATELFKAETDIEITDIMNEKGKINDRILQSRIFGANPNKDWLRMIQVGDCYLKAGSTQSSFAYTLNERQKYRYENKQSVRQLIEYIPAGQVSSFSWRVTQQHLNFIRKTLPDLFAGERVSDEHVLCKLIHKHSLRLIENEIRFWKDAESSMDVDGILEFFVEMKKEVASFPEHSCLLRLGFGTGYLNMTGNWVNDLVADNDTYDKIATATRRTDRYNKLPLPKSRKFMFDGTQLGFVRLDFSVNS